MLLDNLAEENGALPIDQECRWIGRLVGRIPVRSRNSSNTLPAAGICTQFLRATTLREFGDYRDPQS